MVTFQLVDRFFFDGWRRRTGFVTLTTTLILTIVWILSQAFAFGLSINFKDQTIYEFSSSQHGMAWVSELPDTRMELSVFCLPWWWPREKFALPDLGKETKTQFEFLGLRSASNENPIQETEPWKRRCPKRIGVWIIPHWAIVLPLAGLSYFLLSKPMKPTQGGPEPQRPK